MHTLSILSLFLNLFAFYCIACKSTKHMGAYKWYLLAYQTASLVYDAVYSLIILPVIFFPMAMGYPGSWIAHWLSISGHAGVIMVILTCSLLVACILNLFNYRCHLVTPAHHFLKINDNGHIYTSLALTLIYFISCSVGIMDVLPDQEAAKKWVLEYYTCAKHIIHVPRLTVFMLEEGIRIAITVIVLAVAATVITVIWIILSFYFIRRSGQLSRKTKQMQRRFLIYLCVQ
ncbi:7TM chemoreceptor, partial [Ostertagia ostertagi]